MPGFLLHVGATVICKHLAPAQPMQPNPRVKVAGQLVTTMASAYVVSGCPNTVGIVPFPCLFPLWVTTAARIRASSTPVLLADSQAVCLPTMGGVDIVSTQVRVKGI